MRPWQLAEQARGAGAAGWRNWRGRSRSSTSTLRGRSQNRLMPDCHSCATSDGPCRSCMSGIRRLVDPTRQLLGGRSLPPPLQHRIRPGGPHTRSTRRVCDRILAARCRCGRASDGCVGSEIQRVHRSACPARGLDPGRVVRPTSCLYISVMPSRAAPLLPLSQRDHDAGLSQSQWAGGDCLNRTRGDRSQPEGLSPLLRSTWPELRRKRFRHPRAQMPGLRWRQAGARHLNEQPTVTDLRGSNIHLLWLGREGSSP